MNQVDFDPATGRLRLTAGAFEALVDSFLTPGAEGLAEERDALTTSGALNPGGPHELLAPGLSAIARPICQLHVWVTGGFGDQMHQGWVAPEVASLLLAVEGTEYDFITLTPEHVPAAIAAVTRLGPRARFASQIRLDDVSTTRVVVEALLSDDLATRRGAAAQLAREHGENMPEWAAALDSGEWRAWCAETTWAAGGGEVSGRVITVLDTDAGLLLGDPRDGDLVVLQPASPTGVWLEILGLIPGTSEIDPAALLEF